MLFVLFDNALSSSGSLGTSHVSGQQREEAAASRQQEEN